MTILLPALYGMYGGMAGLGSAGYPAGYPNMSGLLSSSTAATSASTNSVSPATTSATPSDALGTLGVAASQATRLGLSPASECHVLMTAMTIMSFYN